MPKGAYARQPRDWQVTGYKVCASCKESKPLTAYKIINPVKSNGRKYTYPYPYCMDCSLMKERARWNALSQEEQRNIWLKRKYGITYEDYAVMYSSQKGQCKLCDKAISIVDKENGPETACVDHCHKTNVIRGLLCNHCNRALGLLGENLQTINKMADYIKEFSFE